MFTLRGEKRRREEKRLSPCLLAGTAAAVLLLALAGAALFVALLAIRAVDGAGGPAYPPEDGRRSRPAQMQIEEAWQAASCRGQKQPREHICSGSAPNEADQSRLQAGKRG